MKTLHKLGLSLLLVLPATQAHAVSVAAQTGVATLSPCPSFCGGSGSFSEFDIDGGDGFTSSYSEILTNINGIGRSSAALDPGSLSLPLLRGEAFGNANAQVTVDAAAMQKYVYSGPQSTFTLDMTLEGEGTIGPHANSDALLQATMLAATASDLDFTTDAGTMLFEVVPLTAGATLLDSATIDFGQLGLFDMGVQAPTASISFTLDDGDMLFVWANLVGRGRWNSSVDAFDTVTLGFSAGNTAGLTAVPLPAPAALLAGGLGLMAFRRRAAAA